MLFTERGGGGRQTRDGGSSRSEGFINVVLDAKVFVDADVGWRVGRELGG